ncbi:MAG: TetR/AcrR family transcriptional regulator, partial [Candidatus Hodarchaeota archaeon]
MKTASKKGKAKDIILNTARNLVEKVGFSNINVNDIAHDANVSIGTLYYHFPKGKIDIMIEILQEMTQAFRKMWFEEDHVPTSEEEGEPKTLNGALAQFLGKLIDIHREYRPYLIAFEAEYLTNFEFYKENKDDFTKKLDLKPEYNFFYKELDGILKKFSGKGLELKGHELELLRVLNILIHRFIF